ncbi:MAG TPA: MM0924 family protein [Pyrinomonadaceae bacterium]
MEELIKGLTGKKIDVSCGAGTALRGEVIAVMDGVVHLRDEDEKAAYVAIDKIATVYECSDSVSRPGFIG